MFGSMIRVSDAIFALFFNLVFLDPQHVVTGVIITPGLLLL